MKKLLTAFASIGIFLASFSVAYAISIFNVQQGGTGVGTFTASQLLYGNGTNPISSVATTSVTCGTGTSCASFTAIGSSPITITAAGGGTNYWTSSGGNIYNNTGAIVQFPSFAATSTSATSTIALGLNIQNWTLSTSTVVCRYPEQCQYQASGTNDDVVVQRAIDALPVSGGLVHVKAGTYNIASRIKLYNRAITFEGEGSGTIFKPTGADSQTIKASSTQAVIIRDIAVDGINQSAAAFSGDISIFVKNSHNVQILHNSVYNTNGFAVFVSSDANTSGIATTSEVRVEGNYLQGNGLQDVIGGGPDETSFGLSSTTDVIITNNQIIQRTKAGQVENSNADFNCIDMVAVQNMLFHGNTCRGNMVYGSEQNPNQYSQITNNIIEAPDGPVLASGDIVVITNNTSYAPLPSNLTINGNTIRSGKILVTGSGININQNILISGNNITTAAGNAQNYNGVGAQGIYLDTINNALVQGNIVSASTTGSTATGIYATNSTNVTVQANNVRDFSGSGGIGVNLNSGTNNRAILNNYLNNTTNESGITNDLTFDTNGRLGVGSTSPGSLLSIGGSATGWNFFNNATTTKSGIGGINILQGCFSINGTCVSGSGGGSGTVTSIATNNGITGGTITTTGTIGLATITQGFLGNIGSAAAVPTSIASTSIFSGITGQFPYFSGTNTITATSSLFISTSGNIGIGTTTPYKRLSMAGNGFALTDQFNTPNFIVDTASTTGPIFAVQATTTGNPTLFSVDQYGHLTASSTGATPTVSCTPSGGTLSANSNDVTGVITGGTLSTSCTLTFAHAYSVTPNVQATGSTVFSGVTAQSTTAFTVSMVATTGDVINYLVIMP